MRKICFTLIVLFCNAVGASSQELAFADNRAYLEAQVGGGYGVEYGYPLGVGGVVGVNFFEIITLGGQVNIGFNPMGAFSASYSLVGQVNIAYFFAGVSYGEMRFSASTTQPQKGETSLVCSYISPQIGANIPLGTFDRRIEIL